MTEIEKLREENANLRARVYHHEADGKCTVCGVPVDSNGEDYIANNFGNGSKSGLVEFCGVKCCQVAVGAFRENAT